MRGDFIGIIIGNANFACNKYFLDAEIDREINGRWGDSKKNPNKRVAGLWFLSRIFFRPKKKAIPISIYDSWEMQYMQNKYIFTFYVLIYLFFNDDDTITNTEKKLMKKLLKKARGILNREHYQIISEFSKSKISKNDVINYVVEKKLNEKIIGEALSDIKYLLGKKSIYTPFIQSIENDTNYL
jgi:hypothetical protein